jgi:hypothetical protein
VDYQLRFDSTPGGFANNKSAFIRNWQTTSAFPPYQVMGASATACPLSEASARLHMPRPPPHNLLKKIKWFLGPRDDGGVVSSATVGGLPGYVPYGFVIIQHAIN